MKRGIKTLLGWITFHTGFYRRYFRDRAVVVLFHRVDDRYAGNPISCTRSEFTGFLKFFRKFFDVITLEELLGRLRDGAPVGGLMVITFDDGYLDNRQFAAPELLRYGLPACFFLATEFLDSRHVAPWDADAGITSEWMSWDDARWLTSNRFEIGAHTMNHVDLSIVNGDEARREIIGSKERLERELGRDTQFFTYPFGRPHQITEENLEIVREAGFSCCLSAYGGTVRMGESPFRLKRAPISPWYRSPYQFGFEMIMQKR